MFACSKKAGILARCVSENSGALRIPLASGGINLGTSASNSLNIPK